MIRKSIIFFIGAGLIACSSYKQTFVKPELIAVKQNSNQHVDSLIYPYKDSMSKVMDVVISNSLQNFGTSRPSISMNNWVSDAVFQNQVRQNKKNEAVICLFNSGGIRSTFLQGPITIGDIYKVMPFDNTLVWVQLPISSKKEIEQFLTAGKSQPISGGIYSNGNLIINNLSVKDSLFWVITSDYLSNGNDGMSFFNSKRKIEYTNKLLREVLIEEAKLQKILIFDSINRMKF
jgi:2',3'-cyclic-nucleotide 2'-phosphodiesterase (5'-nucleotidase family)